jgi:hypothetical protein
MEPCQGEVLGRDREEVAEGDQEGVEAHQKLAMPSGSNRGAAILARVLGGGRVRDGGGFI